MQIGPFVCVLEISSNFACLLLVNLFQKCPSPAQTTRTFIVLSHFALAKSINLSDMVSLQHNIPLPPTNEAFTQAQAQTMRNSIKSHNISAVNQLLRDGFNPAYPLTSDRWNAYLLLVLEGYWEVVSQLVEAGEVDVNYKDEDGFTALMIAADHGDLKMVQTLVSLGADLQATYDGRHTAKSLAMLANRAPVTAYLQAQESLPR